jgi:hypothetical protein
VRNSKSSPCTSTRAFWPLSPDSRAPRYSLSDRRAAWNRACCAGRHALIFHSPSCSTTGPACLRPIPICVPLPNPQRSRPQRPDSPGIVQLLLPCGSSLGACRRSPPNNRRHPNSSFKPQVCGWQPGIGRVALLSSRRLGRFSPAFIPVAGHSIMLMGACFPVAILPRIVTKLGSVP